MSSCSENIFQTPYGNKTLTVDTLSFDHSIITSIKNMNVPAYGNTLYQNKAGQYNDLYTKFLIKFTNFVSMTGLPDSVYATINEANIVLHIADYWGSESNISFDISMLGNDTSLYWENISDVNETFTEIEGNTSFYSSVSVLTDADSMIIPIDTSLVNDWHTRPDSFYVNNGFTVKKSVDLNGLMAFYPIEYSSTENDLRPRLRLECSLYDTNNVYLQDTSFYVIGGGDIQFTESTATVNDTLFYLSQGNIYRSFIELDDLRQDTLLGPTDLLNKAELSLLVDELNSLISTEDTSFLYITARLFKTDYWEDDSISYMYTSHSEEFNENVDTIKIDISQFLQYMISNPKEMQHEGLFFYLNNEYNDFNILTIDPAKTELDIIYTKVKDE
ncbi:MAG: hypothetical protein U9O95_09335 [Candidatus Marinimicrobia bacterium]|nr:hypothetical protein [Candidatus Neomarinimicrobiota bacterium]